MLILKDNIKQLSQKSYFMDIKNLCETNTFIDPSLKERNQDDS